jgi:hypothetical protein
MRCKFHIINDIPLINYYSISLFNRSALLGLVFLLVSTCLNAQILPTRLIDSAFVLENKDRLNLEKVTIPKEYEMQIMAALLYYPELKETNIDFRIKKAIIPLQARPTIWAIFRKNKNRRYVIRISSKTIEKLEPILLHNLSYNAQIGVIGHELSHISDFQSHRGAFLIKLLLWQLSPKKLDKMENKTDRLCIEHGLGYQLLAWSEEVRNKLRISNWNGVENLANEKNLLVKERYLSPGTIQSILIKHPIYQGK